MKNLLRKFGSKAVVAAAMLMALAMAFNVYAQQYVQVNNGTSPTIDVHSNCKVISNSTGQSVFVPTNTSDEWTTFLGHLFSGLSASDCAPPVSYSWQTGGFGSCNASCGDGSQSRSVWCQRNDGATVDDAYCGGGRPADSQSCNLGACVTPTYCFSVTADFVAVNAYAEPGSCAGYHFDLEGKTVTQYCGTSYESCVSQRESQMQDFGGGSCVDMGATAPFWYQKIGSNSSGFPDGGCIGSYYYDGVVRDIGSVVTCDQLPPTDSCL